MNRKIYKLFEPLEEKLSEKGYKGVKINVYKEDLGKRNRKFYIDIYFKGDVGLTISHNTPLPNGFVLFNEYYLDNKINDNYKLKLSKQYYSYEVLKYTVDKDVKALMEWANKLCSTNINSDVRYLIQLSLRNRKYNKDLELDKEIEFLI